MSNINIDIDHEKNTATITASGVLNAEFYALLKGIVELVPKHYSVEGFPADAMAGGLSVPNVVSSAKCPHGVSIILHCGKCFSEGLMPPPSTTKQVRISYDGNTAPILQHPYCGDVSCYLCKPIYLKEQEKAETRKPKRIRITSCLSDAYWYNGRMNEEFDVFEVSCEGYVIENYESDSTRLVHESDAEVIAWYEPEAA